MNEQQFNELLKKLKIPTNNRSYADIFDLLDAKLSEYLDRQDAASQELIDDIQDALDYAEIKKNEVGSGIALKREETPKSEDKSDLSELRNASEKARKEKEQVDGVNGQAASGGQQAVPQPQVQSQNVAGQQAGKLWFSSVNGADNINTMFFQALDDLKYGEFDHAKSIFETILQVEPNNASAYLGKLMAIHELKELRSIGNSYDKDLFSDINMRRAYDHGNDQQRKYLDDAKKEVESGKKYKDADKRASNVDDEQAQLEAAQLFMALGTYRDAVQRKAQCEERVKEIKYSKALTANKRASSAAEYRYAAELYREVAGHKNADKLAEECETLAKRVEVEEDEEKRKDELKASFLKLKQNFEAEEKTQRARCNSSSGACPPDTEELTRCLEAMKKFAADNPEANTLAEAQTHIAKAETERNEIKALVKEFNKASAIMKSEKKRDAFWILAMLVVMFFVGIPALGNYVNGIASFFPIQWVAYDDDFLDELHVNDAKSPYLLSFSKFEQLSLVESERIKVVALPNAKLSSVSLCYGNYSHLKWPDTVKEMSLSDVSGANIPESVETLNVSGGISNVAIPASVKELRLSHSEDERLSLSEGLEKLEMKEIRQISEVTVPSTVRELSIDSAPKIQSVVANGGVTTATFNRCPSLMEITLPTTLQTLIIDGADSLQELTIPEGTMSVAIKSCHKLSKLNLPSTLREIRLEGSMQLETIQFPENLQNLYIYYNDTIKEVIYSENTAVTIRRCENLDDVEG